MVVVHNLSRRAVKLFQNLLCSWTPWVFLSWLQLVKKKQQYDMVQSFGHFRWGLKRQSPDFWNVFYHFKSCKKDAGLISILFMQGKKRLTVQSECNAVWRFRKQQVIELENHISTNFKRLNKIRSINFSSSIFLFFCT